MTLTKAFDLQALVLALKAKGVADVEKLIEQDVLAVVFDWLNSSVQAEVASMPLLAVALPVLSILEEKALAELRILAGHV